MNEILGEINIAYLVRNFTAMFKRKQYCYFLMRIADEPQTYTSQCPVFSACISVTNTNTHVCSTCESLYV